MLWARAGIFFMATDEPPRGFGRGPVDRWPPVDRWNCICIAVAEHETTDREGLTDLGVLRLAVCLPLRAARCLLPSGKKNPRLANKRSGGDPSDDVHNT